METHFEQLIKKLIYCKDDDGESFLDAPSREDEIGFIYKLPLRNNEKNVKTFIRLPMPENPSFILMNLFKNNRYCLQSSFRMPNALIYDLKENNQKRLITAIEEYIIRYS